MRLTAILLASLSLIALVHVVPSAAADTHRCVQFACVDDASVGDPTCADPNSWGDRYTHAGADDGLVGVYLSGDASCWRYDSENFSDKENGKSLYATAVVPLAFVSADWRSYNETETGWGTFSGCEMDDGYWLAGIYGSNNIPCYAGDPVDPGWGHLLP